MRVRLVGILLVLGASPVRAEPPPPEAPVRADLYGDAAIGGGVLYRAGSNIEGDFRVAGLCLPLQASAGGLLERPELWTIRLGGSAAVCAGGGIHGWAGGEAEVDIAVRPDRQVGVRVFAGVAAVQGFASTAELGAVGLRLRTAQTFVGVDVLGVTHPDGYGLGVLGIAGLGGRAGKIIVGGLAAVFLVMVAATEAGSP